MVDSPSERNRGDMPLHGSAREPETLESERVMPRTDIALWPTTKRGVVLWALAALAAVLVGVLPALWINRWRAGTAPQPPRAQVQPQAADTEPAQVAQPAEPAQPTLPAAAEPAQPTLPAATESAPAAASPPARTIKPPRSRPERAKPTPRARKPPPPCDVYLHPKGCPN